MKAHAQGLGRRIAERRRVLGLTQEQLAERARVNVKTVQGVEQGRTEPELRTMRKLARSLGTSVDALIRGSGERAAVVSNDVVLRKIEADLRRLPTHVLDHVAAIVRELAARGRQT